MFEKDCMIEHPWSRTHGGAHGGAVKQGNGRSGANRLGGGNGLTFTGPGG